MEKIFWIDKKAFQVQYHCRICRMDKHPAIKPFLYAKWQELFCLIVTDSTETLTDVLEKGT